MPSFYVPSLCNEFSDIIIDGLEYKHIIKSFRHNLNDIIGLNNGKGTLAEAQITKIDQHYLVAKVLSHEINTLPNQRYAIAFSLLTNGSDENIIEKCTELGCIEFFPFIGDFSIRKPNTNTINRFQKIALSAIKQCNNPFLPKINQVLRFTELFNAILESGYTPIICSEKRPLKDTFFLVKEKINNPCFIIGAEGGFSPDEYSLIEKGSYHQISITTNILRADTAAIAIAVQYLILSK